MGDEFVFRPEGLPRRSRRWPLRWGRTLIWVPAALVLGVLVLPLMALPFGYRTMVVTGDSMSPVAFAGDAAVLRVEVEERVGDVITFHLKYTNQGDRPITDVEGLGLSHLQRSVVVVVGTC
jgi:signal peptidase I